MVIMIADWQLLSQMCWLDWNCKWKIWCVLFVQPDVSGAEDKRVGSGPQLHVLFPARLCSGRQLPLEVCEWRVGDSWPGGEPQRGAGPQQHLHPPWLPKLWSSLDEGCSDLQQGQTYQQGQRWRTGVSLYLKLWVNIWGGGPEMKETIKGFSDWPCGCCRTVNWSRPSY